MTCPFCGAVDSGAYDVQWLFECGSCGEEAGSIHQSKTCRELCQLREKTAVGLTWEDSFFYSSAKSFGDLRFALERCNAFQDSWFVCGNDKLQFQSRDAAKAHAEELHQKAWRELRERWDAK